MFRNCSKPIVQWIRCAMLAVSFFWGAVLAAEPDLRFGSLSCSIEQSGWQVECDYRHAASLEVKEVALKVAEQAVQIPDKGVANYPVQE